MYCINGTDECNGCGWCAEEKCEICGSTVKTAYYGGVCYCRACVKTRKRSRNDG